MFSQKHFSGQAKVEMLDMIGYLKSAFQKILNDIDWMDPTTKSRAYDKLEAMKKFIAYPDELTDESVVEEYHAGLIIDEDDFFGNQAGQQTLETLIKRRLKLTQLSLSGSPNELESAVQALAAEAEGGQGGLARPLLRPHRERLLLLIAQRHDLSRGNPARTLLQSQGTYAFKAILGTVSSNDNSPGTTVPQLRCHRWRHWPRNHAWV